MTKLFLSVKTDDVTSSTCIWVFQGGVGYFARLLSSLLCENHLRGWLTLSQTLTFMHSKWRAFWQGMYFSGQLNVNVYLQSATIC